MTGKVQIIGDGVLNGINRVYTPLVSRFTPRTVPSPGVAFNGRIPLSPILLCVTQALSSGIDGTYRIICYVYLLMSRNKGYSCFVKP